MTLSDLLRFTVNSQSQHKLRSALTMLGVILGAFLVIVTVSIGQGVQEVIPRLMRRNDQLRQITVQPGWEHRKSDKTEEPILGEMSDARRERLTKDLRRRHAGYSNELAQPLNDERLAELAAVEHVESAVPIIYSHVELQWDDKVKDVLFMSVTTDNRRFSRAMVAGRPIASDSVSEIVMHELVAYELGFRNEADLDQLLGSKVRLEQKNSAGSYFGFLLTVSGGRQISLSPEDKEKLSSIIRLLPNLVEQLQLSDTLREILTKSLTGLVESETAALEKPQTVSIQDLTVVGLYRSSTEDEERSLHEHFGHSEHALVPVNVAREFFRKVPGFEQNGYNEVRVRVDDERHVRQVVEHLRLRKYNVHSLVEIVEHLQHQYGLMLWCMTALGMVAMLISALGITNTMLMSVLERTREIGIMKAVGARDGQIHAIFLTEGAFIGLFGAAAALASAWGISPIANSWIQQIVAREARQPVDDQLFLFPWWLIVGIFVITLAITLLAAWLPARRAARIAPVIALRHD